MFISICSIITTTLLYDDDAPMIYVGKVEFNSKSNACSMEGILSNCSTLGGLTYVRGTVMAAVGGMIDP